MLLFLAVGLLVCINGYSQSPQSFPFQAVARDSFGTPMPDQLMKARLSIRDSSGSGTVLYMETDSIVTDNLGMFTINVGQGDVVSGNFNTINWGSAAKYIEIEVDPTGGTSYLNLGASQMLSVPYALYSLNGAGGWGLNGNSGVSDNTYIGTSDGRRVIVQSGVGTTASAAILSLQRGSDSTGTALNAFLYDSLRDNHNRFQIDSEGVSAIALNFSQQKGSGVFVRNDVLRMGYFGDGKTIGLNVDGDSLILGAVSDTSLNGFIIHKDSIVIGSTTTGFYTMPQGTPPAGAVLTAPTANGHLAWGTAATKNRFGITIDGLGDVITTGSKGFTQINYTGTITGWTIIADQAGSCVIDVKRSNYSTFPTTSTIAGSALPTLSDSQKNTDATLSGWGSTTITSGDMFEFVVNSASVVKRVTLVIETSIP